MATITINSVDYFSYATVVQADQYLAADFSASIWRAADEIDKQRALVSATRLLDRQQWVGSKTDEDQAQAWPRTGVAGYEDDEIPQVVIDACILLANDILIGSSVETQSSTASNVKRIKAGSVEQEYFFPLATPTRLSLRVTELLRGLLGSDERIAGSLAYGTDGCSVADDSFRPAGGI